VCPFCSYELEDELDEQEEEVSENEHEEASWD